jgi:tetratricopeptide (TPR) repeat protein
MSKRTKQLILIVAAVQLMIIIGLLALPEVVIAIPGRYRVALAEKSPFLSQVAENLIEQVAPVATVPAPSTASGPLRITIPAFIEPVQPTKTPLPAPTHATDRSAEEDSQNVSPTPLPSPTPEPTSTPSPEPLPQFTRLDGIKRIQQSFNNCGPANLTQVLNWYGDETTQAEAASYLKPNPEDRNVSPWQLSDYVNEFTELRSTVHSNGNVELLKRFIAAGYPVVIEKGYEPGTSGAQGWFGHYLTVFGFDEVEKVFYSMDSYLKVDETLGRADSYEEIEDLWRHFNYNFYVVYEPEQEQEVYGLLGDSMLQAATMWQNAARRAQADLENDPNDAFVWFNLGTSLTRLGELTGDNQYYENGAAAFDQARSIGLPPRLLWYEFRPYLAYMKVGRYEDMIELADSVLATQGGRNVEETYLYQGHALLFNGDVRGATAAYERAIELNENFYPAAIALDSLN